MKSIPLPATSFQPQAYTGPSADEVLALRNGLKAGDEHRQALDRLLQVRRDHAYGPQNDYFDHSDVVGWTRLGDADHPRAIAVVLSDGPGGTKRMNVNRPNRNFTDATGNDNGTITTGNDGWGEFRCNGGSVSVWVEQETI